MNSIGRAMPATLRETSDSDLAVTPTNFGYCRTGAILMGLRSCCPCGRQRSLLRLVRKGVHDGTDQSNIDCIRRSRLGKPYIIGGAVRDILMQSKRSPQTLIL